MTKPSAVHSGQTHDSSSSNQSEFWDGYGRYQEGTFSLLLNLNSENMTLELLEFLQWSLENEAYKIEDRIQWLGEVRSVDIIWFLKLTSGRLRLWTFFSFVLWIDELISDWLGFFFSGILEHFPASCYQKRLMHFLCLLSKDKLVETIAVLQMVYLDRSSVTKIKSVMEPTSVRHSTSN